MKAHLHCEVLQKKIDRINIEDKQKARKHSNKNSKIEISALFLGIMTKNASFHLIFLHCLPVNIFTAI